MELKNKITLILNIITIVSKIGSVILCIYILYMGYGSTYTITYESTKYFGLVNKSVCISPYLEYSMIFLTLFGCFYYGIGQKLPLVCSYAITIFTVLFGGVLRIGMLIPKFEELYVSTLPIKPWLKLNRIWTTEEKIEGINKYIRTIPYVDPTDAKIVELKTKVANLTIEEVHKHIIEVQKEALGLLKTELATIKTMKNTPGLMQTVINWLYETTTGNIVIGGVAGLIATGIGVIAYNLIMGALQGQQTKKILLKTAEDQQKIVTQLKEISETARTHGVELAEVKAQLQGGNQVKSLKEIQQAFPGLELTSQLASNTSDRLLRLEASIQDGKVNTVLFGAKVSTICGKEVSLYSKEIGDVRIVDTLVTSAQAAANIDAFEKRITDFEKAAGVSIDKRYEMLNTLRSDSEQPVTNILVKTYKNAALNLINIDKMQPVLTTAAEATTKISLILAILGTGGLMEKSIPELQEIFKSGITTKLSKEELAERHEIRMKGSGKKE